MIVFRPASNLPTWREFPIGTVVIYEHFNAEWGINEVGHRKWEREGSLLPSNWFVAMSNP